MNRINYQKQLEEVLKRMKEEGKRKRLLLHACCAPCSSYCLEYLREAFALTVFFYNPNLTEQEEYRRRVEEEKRLIDLMKSWRAGMNRSAFWRRRRDWKHAKKAENAVSDVLRFASARRPVLPQRADLIFLPLPSPSVP